MRIVPDLSGDLPSVAGESGDEPEESLEDDRLWLGGALAGGMFHAPPLPCGSLDDTSGVSGESESADRRVAVYGVRQDTVHLHTYTYLLLTLYY